MAELDEELLNDALNSISNYEANRKIPRQAPSDKNQEDQLKEIFDNLGDDFTDDILKSLTEVDADQTNELIENVLGELISKEILYEPFVCLQNKIEAEIKQGNTKHSDSLIQVKEILTLMDLSENNNNEPKAKERLMQLIYELQEQGDLWSSLTEDDKNL